MRLNHISSPEEGVMLHASLPESLGCLVVAEFETNGRFIGLKFPRPNFDKKVISFVRKFQDFRPCESVYPQPEEKPGDPFSSKYNKTS